MIGHSIGEFVAACLSGVFSLEDALRLVATRGRLMQGSLPGGSMLSVKLPAIAVEPRLSGELAIAAVNAPDLCVVSGPTEAIAALQQMLEQEEIVCRPLHTSHAFHSPMVDSIVEPFAECVRSVPLHAPKIPFVSTVTADWITPEQATDPMYWTHHLRATVQFADGIQTLWQQPDRVLLEVGPRTTAATLARRQAQDLKRQIAVSSLGDSAVDQAEWGALLQAVGRLWLAGVAIDWAAFYANERRYRVALPTYAFDRKRFWIEPKLTGHADSQRSEVSAGSNVPSTPIPEIPTQPTTEVPMPQSQPMLAQNSRQQRLIPQLKEILEDTSGLELDDVDAETTFLEMGLDSLSLTQVGTMLQRTFSVKVTFRQLLEEIPTLGTLAEFMDSQLPAEAAPTPQPAPVAEVAAPVAAAPVAAVPAPAPIAPTAPVATVPTPIAPTPVAPTPIVQSVPTTVLQPLPAPAMQSIPSSGLESVISQQLHLMSQQLHLLSGSSIAQSLPISTIVPPPPAAPVAAPAPVAVPPVTASSNGSPAQLSPAKGTPLTEVATNGHAPAADGAAPKPFGAAARINTSESETLTPQQRQNLDAFIQSYTTRTKQSKQFTQKNRSRLADPRAVSGFNRTMKELVYPIVTNRSAGCKLWDLDGNEYVDLASGFGSNFFGYTQPIITEAIAAQMQEGFEIGPQTPLAGEVADLVCELTHLDRAAFCNTGSEAVLGAMRLARTVTGRNTIAVFTGAYHGIFDEVVVRGTQKAEVDACGSRHPALRSRKPAGAGLRHPRIVWKSSSARAHELAAIMVEPVQSRRPELQPREFLHELRRITQESGAAFIVDEVITGFRIHPGGAQAHFGVPADIATYGKVAGGGLSVGIIAGKKEFMDALDGGFWEFGDGSFPEVGVTYFAGTFVRHPLTLAATRAALLALKQGGAELQQGLNQKTDRFVAELSAHFKQVEVPFQVKNFGSLFKFSYPQDLRFGELLFYWLRSKGVHIWDFRPCFLTLSHYRSGSGVYCQRLQGIDRRDAGGWIPASARRTGRSRWSCRRSSSCAGSQNGSRSPGQSCLVLARPGGTWKVSATRLIDQD